MNDVSLEKFFSSKKYDIRLTRNGRWIDQKCAYDVVNFVADCIIYYLDNGGEEPFTSPAIWRSDYAVRFVQEAFGKPYPLDEASHDEFNKFFRQPMKMLSAAGVLEESKVSGAAIRFRVSDRGILDFIALRPRNALVFLQDYIEKTLRDSGLWDRFEAFFSSQTQDSYDDLKHAFEWFCYANTPIRNKRETGRVFAKVLNPLALKRHKKGSEFGRLSCLPITPDKVSYNRMNWRDEALRKDKGVSRRTFIQVVGDARATEDYLVRKQMKFLKQFNREYMNSKSEVVDSLGLGEPATQAHHIFPRSQHPEIADYLENIIMLTSAQHYEKAHPNGNTQETDLLYQYVCLQSKIEGIRKNIEGSSGIPVIYDSDKLRYVLGCGLGTDYFELIDMNDFNAVSEGVCLHYPAQIVSQFKGDRFG